MVKSFSTFILAMLITVISYAADIDSFDGFIGHASSDKNYQFGRAFNTFMLKIKGKIVKLNIKFDDNQNSDFNSSLNKPDDYNRTYFFVESNSFESSEVSDKLRGAEYLIHLPKKQQEYHFTYSEKEARLVGCFTVFNISGPRQMIYSINLRPIRCTK